MVTNSYLQTVYSSDGTLHDARPPAQPARHPNHRAPPPYPALQTYKTTQMNDMPLDLSQSVSQVHPPEAPLSTPPPHALSLYTPGPGPNSSYSPFIRAFVAPKR